MSTGKNVFFEWRGANSWPMVGYSKWGAQKRTGDNLRLYF